MEKFPKIGEAVAAVANWRRRRYIKHMLIFTCISNTTSTSDSYRNDPYKNEWSVWKSEMLTVTQMHSLYR